MKFDDEKIVDAVVKTVKNIDELETGPCQRSILKTVYRILKITRTPVQKIFRTSLAFRRSKNEDHLRDKIIERVLCKVLSQSLSVTPECSQRSDQAKPMGHKKKQLNE